MEELTTYQKGEITRLRNLLRLYRDHIITNQYNFLKQSPYNWNITDVIDIVDSSISIITKGL